LARGEAEVQARLSALDQLLSHLAEPLRRVDAAVEETLLALTLSFTEAIIGERPPPSEAALAALLREALEALPDPDREAVVYLNPLDLQRLGAVLEVEMPGRPWRLEADEGLELGDLRVQAGLTEVDARRRTRMVQLFETLMPGDEASEGRAER
jgi:flagellar assembly protein FliH